MNELTVKQRPLTRGREYMLFANEKVVALGFHSVFAAKRFVKQQLDRAVSFCHDTQKRQSYTHVTDDELLKLKRAQGGDAPVPMH